MNNNKKAVKECVGPKVLNPKTKRCNKLRCKNGLIPRNAYVRKPYTRKNGTKVDRKYISAKCIKSRGLPGKTSDRYTGKNKGIGKLKKGELGKHGYANVKNLSLNKRQEALNSAVKEYSAPKILKKLGAIKTYQKNKDPQFSSLLQSNMKWVRKTYDEQFKSSWKDSNLFKK